MTNARSLKNKLSEFKTEIFDNLNKPKIIGITETWFDESIPDNVLQCDGEYDVFRCDRNLQGGGVAILAKKELKASKIDSTVFEGLELIVIQAKFKSDLVIFACFYRSSVTNTVILPKFKAAIEFLTSKSRPLVLMGDFNLPGIIWNEIPKASGICQQDEFLEIFLSNGLSQQVNSPTRNDVILDLVLTNEPELVQDVLINSPFSASCDHNVVVFNLSLKSSNAKTVKKIRLWHKADIVSIGLKLESINWSLFFKNCPTVDQMWIQFRLLCHDLFELFVPTKFISERSARPKYPNYLKRLLRRKNKAFKTRHISDNHMAKYKTLSKTCTLEIRKFHTQSESLILDGSQSKVVPTQ